MTAWLKQSTAVTLLIGPFLDETDGKTAETGLTISQADVRLSKNGGNMAQKNESTACTHDEIGMYTCKLDATDTNTLGILQVCVHESGALPVFATYMVVPANVWDSMFGSDYLKTEVVEISGDSTAADNLEADYDGTGYAKTASTTKLHSDYDAAKTAASQSSVNTVAGYIDTEVAAILAAVDTEVAAIKTVTDAIGATGTGLTAIPWNSAWDAEVQSECTDALNAYDPPTHTEMTSAFSTTNGKIDAVDDFVDTEVAAILAAVDTEVAAIKAKTDNLPASPAAVGSQMDLVNAPNATAITAIQSGLATAAALDAVDNFVDTEVGAIKAVTDKLDTALELDSTVYRFTTNALEQGPSGTGATAQQVWEYTTRTLTSAGSGGATLEEIEGSTVLAKEATLTTIDTVVDAIKAKTDGLNFTGTDVKATLDGEKVTVTSNEDKTGYSLSTAPPTAAAIADAVCDEALSGHTTAGSVGKALSDTLADTNELQTNQGNWVTATGFSTHSAADVVTAIGTGSTFTAIPWNAAWDAEVQSECTDALNAYDLVAANIEAILEDTRTTLPATLATIEGKIDTADAVADAIKAVTDAIGATGSGLSAVPWNAAWDAEVQSECTDALNAYDPPTKAEVDASIAAGDDAVLAVLGSPAGASMSADIAAVKSETAAIVADTNEVQAELADGGRTDLLIDGIKTVTDAQGATGSGLSAVPWNAAWDAEVQSECTDALNAYDPPTKAELDAGLDAIPTATENADALLNRDMSAVSDTTARSPLNALRQLRNKVAIVAGTMTVYEEDDATEAWTAALTTDASAEAITVVDPA